MHPSQPFQSNKSYSEQTPLHLAALYGLDTVVMLFLEHGGNPDEPNGHDQTSLHSVCMKGDLVDKRTIILDNLMGWRRQDPLFGELKVSVNHVDSDGNIALHYAARSGLLECVIRLLERNSIISLVNKDQNTCCDEADAANHSAIADMLEAALVFQPAEDDFGGLDLEAENSDSSMQSRYSALMLDTQSMATGEMYDWAQRSISLFVEVTNLPVGRVLAILGGYDWDVSRALQEYVMNPDSALKSAHLLTPEPVSATALPDVSETTPKRRLNFGVEPTGDEDESMTREMEMETENTVLVNSEVISSVMLFPPPPPVFNTETDRKSELEPELCPICCDELRPPVSAIEALAELGPDCDDNRKIDDMKRHALSCHAGHTFCIQCWSSHSTVQIVEMGAGVLQCPGFKCHECVDDDWAAVLFPLSPTDGAHLKTTRTSTRSSEEILKKLKDNKVRRIVDRQASLMWCPVADCGCIVILPKKSELVDSPTASAKEKKKKKKKTTEGLPSSAICGRGHAFCTSCSGAAHSPCSCDAWIKWQLKIQSAMETAGNASDGGDLANALWVAANTKRCPKCKLPIEKNEGCNHMSCRKCRYEFCWVCMQDWNLHSQNTGGYFQCNRYIASDSAENRQIDNEDDFSSGIYGDIGSSRREDMRLRRAGERMERFLHHFTRFRSHEDSYNMECKMHMDTLERLCRILMMSLDESSGYSYSPTSKLPFGGQKFENLQWLQTSVENPFARQDRILPGQDENDRLLVEELRLLREHQKELLAQKGAAEEAAKKNSVESKSWLTYMRESLYSVKEAADEKQPPRSDELSVRVGNSDDNLDKIVPSILLFAARGDILDTNLSDFNESFGLGQTGISNADSSKSMINRLRGLDFLQNGFRELLKCRQILKGSFAYAYFYFSDDDEGELRTYSRQIAIQTRKLMFEQGQADLNARTETLSDVCARRRLRASRSIIDQATKAARMSRIAFERTLATCASDIEDIDSGQRNPSRRSNNTQNLRQRSRAARLTAEGVAALDDHFVSRRRHSTEAEAVNLPPANSDLPSTQETFSSEYLDRQLRMILDSLEDIDRPMPTEDRPSSGLISGASTRPPAPPTPADRGQMGPAWSPGISTSLHISKADGSPAPRSSQSPPRKMQSKSLLSHPDRGLIEALQSDGLDDDQIKTLLGISAETSDGATAQESSAVSAPSSRHQAEALAVMQARSNVSEREREDNTFGVEEDPDADSDMNMAILLSIQDPRLNDITLRGEIAVAVASQVGQPAGEESVASSEENISALTAMGFSREEAQQALTRAGNDVEVAIYALLSRSA